MGRTPTYERYLRYHSFLGWLSFSELALCGGMYLAGTPIGQDETSGASGVFGRSLCSVDDHNIGIIIHIAHGEIFTIAKSIYRGYVRPPRKQSDPITRRISNANLQSSSRRIIIQIYYCPDITESVRKPGTTTGPRKPFTIRQNPSFS